MVKTITLTRARARLGTLCEQDVKDKTIVLIRRRSKKNVVLISATELSGLMETLHLLKSPRNAERLLTAINLAADSLASQRGTKS